MGGGLGRLLRATFDEPHKETLTRQKVNVVVVDLNDVLGAKLLNMVLPVGAVCDDGVTHDVEVGGDGERH